MNTLKKIMIKKIPKKARRTSLHTLAASKPTLGQLASREDQQIKGNQHEGENFLGLPLYPPSLATVRALEQIESPLLKEGTPSTLLDIVEVLLILTTEPSKVDDMIKDRQAFHSKARAFARKVPIDGIKGAGLKVSSMLNSAFSAAVAPLSYER